MSKQRAKGTSAESACVKWFIANGYPLARRQALAGALDKGDVYVDERLVAEVKSYSGGASVGQPSPGVLASWMLEAATEAHNAGAQIGLLVVKRAGTTDPGKWWAYIPCSTLTPWGTDAPVCMTLASFLAWYRAQSLESWPTGLTSASQSASSAGRVSVEGSTPDRLSDGLSA